MPTLILTPRYTEDAQLLWRTASELGWDVERLRTWRVPEELRAVADPVLYLEALFGPTLAEQFGRQLLEPPIDWLPRLPFEYRKREVQLTTLREARKLSAPAFIKPPNDKSFPARVYRAEELPTGYDEDSPVLVSEIVEWENEFRCFILDRRLMTHSIYLRDGVLQRDNDYRATDDELAEASAFVRSVVEDPQVDLPRTAVLDVGVMKERGWAVVEQNAAWGSGIYACDPVAVLEVLRHSAVPMSQSRPTQDCMTTFRRVASFKTADDFKARLAELGIDLPFDDAVHSGSASPLAQSIARGGMSAGNRWAVLPMEGWDGTEDGKPTELTRRRWGRFGQSGAKLIWGGEAVAVRHDGRANPNQLVMSSSNVAAIAELREHLVSEHRSAFGKVDDLQIGLQLTHSGRFSRPNEKKRLEPTLAYRHPILDRRVGAPPEQAPISDDGIRRLIDDFVSGAKLAHQAGFAFIDVKHCHGYFGHELLSAYDRPGPFGGLLENRTRFLREIVHCVHAETNGLQIGVRISAFDFVPFKPGPDGVGVPDALDEGKRYTFGGDGGGLGVDLAETKQLLQAFVDMGIAWVCVSAGNPYANPHILRPAAFPPSDGYLPPEDPLIGVARQINAVAELKAAFPNVVLVGSGYTYLQDWLPNVAQAAVGTGAVDVVGLGRTILTYPELPADVLAGKTIDRKRLCRTFSDCTSGPRNGLVSGCFPLDPFYKVHPDHERLLEVKKK